ncbi:NAD(P)-dependent oxidoreductase [Alphaproteobacteria bacterium]|nr:NAD(P)-dependent oxidoreductase [Alphaproteobacteria bacterium]
MRVLITGASGFIGRPLAENLSRLGLDVLAISRSIPKNSNMGQINWFQADLSSINSYKTRVIQFSPQIVIHLAWQDIPDFSIEKSKLNLEQSLDFIYFISNLKSCKKILFSGSCLEYDDAKGKCVESNIIKGYRNYFSLAKNTLRKKVEIICKNKSISFAWFRIFYVYGPGQRSASLLPSIFNQLKKNQLPKINLPFNSNDYIYIDDVVNAFVKATLNDFSSGIFNLGSGISSSVIQVCRYAEKIVLNTSFLSDELEANMDNKLSNINFWASIIKVNKDLEWSPKTSLVEGIKKTWMSLN